MCQQVGSCLNFFWLCHSWHILTSVFLNARAEIQEFDQSALVQCASWHILAYLGFADLSAMKLLPRCPGADSRRGPTATHPPTSPAWALSIFCCQEIAKALGKNGESPQAWIQALRWIRRVRILRTQSSDVRSFYSWIDIIVCLSLEGWKCSGQKKHSSKREIIWMWMR